MAKLKIALDCNGGDHGLHEVITAAEIIANELPDISVTLYGPASLAEHTPTSMRYIANSGTSSLDNAIKCLSNNRVDAVVSGAHTASHITACKDQLECTSSRAILAAFIPNIDSSTSILLDAGATLHADARQLTEFGVMGLELARCILGITRPTVGILNIGTEHNKGTPAIQQAAQNLRQLSIHLDFDLAGENGFIEANRLLQRPADIIVSDGWSGNLIVKTAEAAFKGLTKAIAQEAHSSYMKQIKGWFASSLLRTTLSPFKPENHNGGLWLGVKKGVVVKSHGNSKAAGIAAAVKLAIRAVKAKCTASVNNALVKANLIMQNH